MTIFKRLLLFFVLLVPLASAFIGLQTHVAHATQAIPTGSCGDTISDDGQLFGNRVGDVLNQAQAVNKALQADTRVVTVSQSTLGTQSPKDYYYYVQSKCPNWAGQNFIVFVVAKGYDPFLHLGSTFNGKMTAADYQQMTLGVRSELTSGNYAQGTIDLLQQVQKKLSPDYTWIWVTLAVLVVLIVGGILGFVFVRRRQNVVVETAAREQAMATKQAAVDLVSSLGKQSKELSPRVEVLLALVPTATANSLRALFQTAQGQQSRIEEHLGNLLSRLDARPGGNASQVDYYKRMQLNYQQVYNEARGPQNLLQGVETAVTRLEQNPQAQIDFRQLTALSAPQEGIVPQGFNV
ncbi:MAG: hypothetical protein NVS4B1_36010 [Ktedonobacteraceae bacterium]